MKNTLDGSLHELSLHREHLYSFTAQMLSGEITQDTLDRIAQIEVTNCDEDQLTSGWRRVVTYARASTSDTVTELAVDFAATFLGVGPTQGGAFPYESVYTSDHKLMSQTARDDMIEILHFEGIDVGIAGVNEEDHVAVELALLAFWARKTSEALESGAIDYTRAYEAKRTSFLSNHVLIWIPRFCDDVRRIAQTDFYRGLADILEGFLSFDAQSGTLPKGDVA